MRIVALTGPDEPLLDPDLVWNGAFADLALSGIDDPVNPGGLQAKAALTTAVLLCLMTDRRADPTELRDGDVNRGWPGDGFDIEAGETPLGSKLWLLQRRALTDEVELLARDYARDALQTLIDQRAFARIDVEVSFDRPRNRLDLIVRGYGGAGTITFDQKFAVLWEQI